LFSLAGFCLQANDSCCNALTAQGEFLSERYASGYNKEAATAVTHKLRHGLSDSNFFIDASFTYWYLSQEGLKIATNGVLASGSNLLLAKDTSSYFPHFNYKPGFKIGIGGVNCSEWQWKGEYTWVHANIETKTTSLPPNEISPAGSLITADGTAVFVMNDWFLQGSTLGQPLAASAISSKWLLNMNLIDLTVGRPYYQGRNLTIHPFGGLQIAVISQKMNLAIFEAIGQLFNLPSQPIRSLNNSHSWGLGPTIGFDGNCLLPCRFRLEGNGALSLLYTTYTSIKHSEDAASTLFNIGPYTASLKNYRAIRPNASLELGLGWGKYTQNGATHIDLSLTYNFAIYWAQNMMRKLLDDISAGISPAPADLFTQGLTVTGRLDF